MKSMSRKDGAKGKSSGWGTQGVRIGMRCVRSDSEWHTGCDWFQTVASRCDVARERKAIAVRMSTRIESRAVVATVHSL